MPREQRGEKTEGKWAFRVKTLGEMWLAATCEATTESLRTPETLTLQEHAQQKPNAFRLFISFSFHSLFTYFQSLQTGDDNYHTLVRIIATNVDKLSILFLKFKMYN